MKIVSLSPLPVEFIENMLKGRGIEGVTLVAAHAFSREEMKAALGDADFVLGDFTFRNGIDADIIAGANRLKFIQQPSVGYQHIDVDACRRAGIGVANCAGANTIAVAEHTVMAALCLLKKTVAATTSTRRGEWRQMELRPVELSGKTWSLVGMGRIGRAVAERIRPFGVRALYHDINRLDARLESELGLTYGGIDELLGGADILSLHCPLTEATRGLLSAKTLAVMKQGAIIINVARGEIIDEEALAKALEEGRLGGAALDVFTEEPPREKSPLFGVKGENLLLTPHVAGVTTESQLRIMAMTMDNLVRVLNDKEPENIVN